jgi:hypothetical protein
MGVPGFGDRALPASLSTGVFGGDQAQIFYQWSGILDADQVTQFGYAGHGDRALNPTPGLERLDHRLQAPGFDLRLQLMLQSVEAFGVLVDRADVFLENDWLRWGGTDHFREPPQVGRPPGGPARIADILAQGQRFEAKLGGLEIADGIFTRTTQITDGFVFDRGDIDGGHITRAHQPSPWHGVAAVGFHPVARLFRNQGGGDDPAAMSFWGQSAREPGATRSCFIDKDEVFGLGLQFADEAIEVDVSCADGAEVDDVRIMILCDVSHSSRLFVDIQANVQRARLVHG